MCVCVNVSVLVGVSVWKCEERRCGVVMLKSLKKTHFKITLSLSLAVTNKSTKQTVLLHLFSE